MSLEISEQLQGFIKENILAEGVGLKGDTELSTLGIDSFSLIEIILFIERKFAVALPDEQLTAEVLKSTNSLAITVQKHLS